MLADGLFTRFPKPEFALALHCDARYAHGQVNYREGPMQANVDSVDIVVRGRGGHGAAPHRTIDPVVIASRIVIDLQTIVSREVDPLDAAVVTVGSIHGGTKHNVIPDDVRLQLTVRSYDANVRAKLLAAIARIAKAEAAAAGAPREPTIEVSEGTSAMYNDPELTRRVVGPVRKVIGDANVREQPPVMGGEDFSEFGRAGIPSVLLWVGAVEPRRYAAEKAAGRTLPSLHSSLFAPDAERTIRTGVTAETAVLLELLGKR
jgi:hippurate hydrolase